MKALEREKKRMVFLTDAEIWALRNALQCSIEVTGEQDAAEESAYAQLVAAQDEDPS